MNYFKFAEDLALECGEIIKAAYEKGVCSFESKSYLTDLVTKTDREIEELSKKRILEKYPDHKFIGEESKIDDVNCELTDDPTWIIDPIDGTTNFVNGFPYCAYSMALYINKQAEVAIIYNSILKQFYHAIRSNGAFLNDTPIKISQCDELRKALVCSDWGNDRDMEKLPIRTNNFKNVVAHCRGVRSMGCASMHMCLVASGCSNAYYEYGIHCWDIAAGRLIVEEAGGVCTNCDGSPLNLMSRQILACGNAKLVSEVSSLLQTVSYPFD